jgi:molybdopterin adenylyltransferase
MSYEEHAKAAAAAELRARCAVVTVSDSRTEANDVSGKLIREILSGNGHGVVHYGVVSNDRGKLEELLGSLVGREDVDAIFTTGGTGVGRRDQTVDVVAGMLDRELEGFGELFRFLSWEQIGSGAILSRAIGGVAKGKLVFAMPGSSGAVELAVTKLIVPEIRHLLRELSR